MLKKWKKIVSAILAVSTVLMTATVFAESITEENLVSKTAEIINEEENSFKVQLNVPGVDGSELHDEVILMVDGSYSGDNEWSQMKNAIITIGETVLNGSGNTQLTLMAFGMGDNNVLTHIADADELSTALGELPGTLLYGRSSTNCEAGFTGVEEYIVNHDETLNDAHVLYISDGEINTDETPYDFYNWKENTWLRWSADTIIAANFGAELEAIAGGANRSEAFVSVFGEDSDIEEVSENATSEQLVQWSDNVWATVYAYSDLTPGEEYPVSDVERAFVKYDKENNTYLQDNFYYALVGRGYPNKSTRTVASAAELAKAEKVKSMYLIDSNTSTAWMQGVEGTEFIPAGSIAGLIDALEGVLTDLAKTPFNDVVVTDYMSKWVNLDKDSVAIVDNTTDTIIYNTADGWLIPENERPTSKSEPVSIELVSAENYADGGEAVKGNTSGDIYKIVWTVKDGAMLRSDSYHLEYSVTVDTEEQGFVYGKEYPANGTTAVAYVDEDGNVCENEILVPDVSAVKGEYGTDANEITFKDAKYAYIFGYEPIIRTVTNSDGTEEREVIIEMAMDDAVTVEQVCAMLSRAIDQEYDNTPDTYEASEKTAAHRSAWYYRGISYLDSLGAFDNGEKVVGAATRGQVAQIIALGLNLGDANETAEFEDISESKFKGYIDAVVEHGYMQGVSKTEFEPDAVMTRAQFCRLFNNILGKTGLGLIARAEDGTEYEVTAQTYYFVDMSPSHWAYKDCLIATSAYFDDGYVDMDTRLANIRNKLDQYDSQKEY